MGCNFCPVSVGISYGYTIPFIPTSHNSSEIFTGSTVDSKPPSADTLSLKLFTKIMEEVGIPEDIFNVVIGRGDPIGNSLGSDDRISSVNFSSTKMGWSI